MSLIEEKCEKAKKQFIERGHHAVLVTETNDITVIDWLNKHNGSDYYVRYILSRTDHRQNIYVSGDLGDAVFEMYWDREEMTVKAIAKRRPESNINYIHGKMQCGSDNYHYDYDTAEGSLRDYLKDYEDFEGHRLEEDEIDEIIADVMEDFNSETGFGSRTFEIISDRFEWDIVENLSTCGQEIHFRVYLWIVGLIMACRQLKDAQK